MPEKKVRAIVRMTRSEFSRLCGLMERMSGQMAEDPKECFGLLFPFFGGDVLGVKVHPDYEMKQTGILIQDEE